MGSAKLLVCPSSYDAAPNIVFEACAMGCNVVTSRNSGNWEVCSRELVVDRYSRECFRERIDLGVQGRHRDNWSDFVSRDFVASLMGSLDRDGAG
jgi:hypothetical protein